MWKEKKLVGLPTLLVGGLGLACLLVLPLFKPTKHRGKKTAPSAELAVWENEGGSGAGR